MDGEEKLMAIISESFLKGKIVGIVDRDFSAFTYIPALRSLKKPLEEGRYIWVVSYEPLQSLFRDFRRAGLDYESHLGKNLYVLDVFGSMRHIDSGVNGVFVLSGYLDDRVFILKYRTLIQDLLSELGPEDVIVVGYLESGMCRLFDNPIRAQKLLWNLREESRVKTAGLITYIKPECPALEEFIYLYSDYVFEGVVENGLRRVIMTKGDEE
ncbi:hypothetical protein [Thermococcus gammatolerans]|nr:hypothetical protein [Thermococcus gammatolerans]